MVLVEIALQSQVIAENDTNNDAALETDAITINATYEINENSQLVYVGSTRDTSEYRIYGLRWISCTFHYY